MRPAILTALLLTLASVPAAADPTPVVLVSGEKKTRFAKLGEALAAAKPGDRVVVESGEHRGAFVLPAGVRLEGKGTLVSAGRRPALTSSGTGASVSDLRFQGPKSLPRRGPATGVLLDVPAGDVRVENCQFSGGMASGIQVGAGAKGTIERCLFLDMAGVGLRLIGTETSVRYCRIRNVGAVGIRMTGSRARVSRTVIESCRGSGIYVDGEDDSAIEHCHIARNVRGGVTVFGRGHTRIERNSFVGNLGTAVSFDIAASVTVRGNVLVDNTVGVRRFETAHETSWMPDHYPLGRSAVADNALCGNGRDYANFATDPVGYRADRRFRGPPAGDYRPAAGSRLLREGFPWPEAGLSDAHRTPPAPPPEPREEVTGTVVGRILDENGDPLSGAWIILGRRRRQRTAVTRPDGSYRLTEVPEGRWTASSSARGHLIRMWPDPVCVRPGETTELPDLRLPRDLPITGRIDNGRDEPAPGAVAWALDPDRPGATETRRGIAGWNGKFRVGFLPEGRRVLFAFRRLSGGDDIVVVHGRIGIAAGSGDVRLSRGVERVVIHVADGVAGSAAELELMVRGTPAAGGEVLLARWKRVCELRDLEWPMKLSGREVTLSTLLPPGTYDFVVRRIEHRRVVRVAHRTGVVVRPNEGQRIELVTERPGRIEGRVVDAEGNALAGALIESAEVGPPPALLLADGRDPPRLYRTFSSESGTFRIDAVMPGERRLRVRAAGYRERVVTVPGVESRKTARIRVELTR